MSNMQLLVSLFTILGMNLFLYSLLLYYCSKQIDHKMKEVQRSFIEYKDMLKESVRESLLK